MSGLVRFAFTVLCVGLAVFCVFGFLAAPEAGAESVVQVRLVYGVICVAFVGTAYWLMRPIRAESQG